MIIKLKKITNTRVNEDTENPANTYDRRNSVQFSFAEKSLKRESIQFTATRNRIASWIPSLDTFPISDILYIIYLCLCSCVYGALFGNVIRRLTVALPRFFAFRLKPFEDVRLINFQRRIGVLGGVPLYWKSIKKCGEKSSSNRCGNTFMISFRRACRFI